MTDQLNESVGTVLFMIEQSIFIAYTSGKYIQYVMLRLGFPRQDGNLQFTSHGNCKSHGKPGGKFTAG